MLELQFLEPILIASAQSVDHWHAIYSKQLAYSKNFYFCEMGITILDVDHKYAIHVWSSIPIACYYIKH